MGKGRQIDPEERVNAAERAYLAFMQALGLPWNDETRDTPGRVARMFYNEFSNHLKKPPPVAVFKANGYDQYVVVKDIQFDSLCEHHHLPFSGMVHVGYHPGEYLAGLSKIPRVVRFFAGRPQLQERLVMQIADYLWEQLKPGGVMVVAKAVHSCMRCRGVRDPQSETVTSRVIDSRDDILDKQEMLALMGLGRG